MSNKNEDFKKTLTKVVSFTVSTETGKKSGGTKIASIVRDVPVIPIVSFTQ